MVTQRVRIPCPNCSHRLHIRVEDIGRKGECKYCGHRFRPRVKYLPDSSLHRTVPGVAGPDYPAADLGQWMETLERRLEKSWACLSAKQVSVIEQLMVALGGLSGQSVVAVKQPAGAPSRLSPQSHAGTHRLASEWPNGVAPPDGELAATLDDNDTLELRFEDATSVDAQSGATIREGVLGVTEGRFEIAGTGTDTFQFQGEIPIVASALATSPAHILECVNRLVRERDEARAQCARLVHEVDHVRKQMAERLSEVARLRKSADRLKTVRAERDQLNAERAMLAREATQLQARMVETQVALVEVEAELDDCRQLLSAERQEWQQQRLELIEEAEHQRSRLRSQTETEEGTAERRHQAEVDRLKAALEDTEVTECAPEGAPGCR